MKKILDDFATGWLIIIISATVVSIIGGIVHLFREYPEAMSIVTSCVGLVITGWAIRRVSKKLLEGSDQ